MDKNELRYCTLLLIDNGNHSKIFISKKNMYYIKNKSIRIKIFNKFKDIKKSYGINVNDITDNYYKIDSSSIMRSCTILLIDEDDDHCKIFISEKKLYYTNNDGYYEVADDDDDKLYYKKPLNDFERLVSVKNNIVNLINNGNNHKHKITLLVDNIFVCKNAY